MNEELVRKWFIRSIQSHPQASPELKRALFAKGSMLNKYTELLYKELVKAEDQVKLKNGKGLKADTLKSFVKDMADGFVNSMEKAANERMQSDLKKLSVQKEAQDKKDMESTFNGQASGFFEEHLSDGSLILDEDILQRPDPGPKGTRV